MASPVASLPSPPAVVLLVQQPLAARDRERFGLAALQGRGHPVRVLDVADLVFPMLDNDRRHYAALDRLDIAVVRTARELAACRSALTAAQLVICNVGAGYVTARSLAVLRLVASVPTPYLIMASSTPNFVKSAPREGLTNRLRRLNPLNSLLARLPLRLLGLRPADIVVVPALRCDLARPLLAGARRRIFAHVLDYDLYLAERQRPAATTETAVFLDQYFGFHPDFGAMGMRPLAPERFYPALRRFFDRVEHELGLEVVVAAHPRADYAARPGLFGERRVVQGETARLVRESRLVIAGTSTAIMLAVLFAKPLLFYATRDLQAHPHLSAYLRGQAEYFGGEVLAIDEMPPADLATFVHHPDHAGRAFIDDWVRHPEAPDKPYWDIVFDALAEDGVLSPANPAPVPRRPAAPRAARAAR